MKKVFIFLVLLLFSVFVSATDKVEINTASLEQLEEITGVGPVIAQRIIDARPFSSVDDLLRVKGIGEKTLQKIKDQGLAYVGEKSKILNSKSEINSNEQNLNIQNTAEQPGDVGLPAGS
ncbi:MAG: ComEA family DNA-binding protein, partial [Patescibacteria group bacterium]